MSFNPEEPTEPEFVEGGVFVTRYGFGFISRGGEKTDQVIEDPTGTAYRFQAASDDVYMSPRIVNEYNLKDGDFVKVYDQPSRRRRGLYRCVQNARSQRRVRRHLIL